MPQSTETIRKILTGDRTFATTLLIIFTDLYGTEGFEWSPESIAMELSEQFNVKIPAPNLHRLLTAINLVVSDDFYKSLPDFVQHCNILCGDTYDPNQWDPADASEIAWGITEAMLINPPDEDDESPFVEEITAYIGQVLVQEGIMQPPDILRIATSNDDAVSFVAAQYSDDPGMFDAIYDFEVSKTETINQQVRTNLEQLAAQLSALPLQAGTTKMSVQQLLEVLTHSAH